MYEYERRQKTKRELLYEFLTDFLSYAGRNFSQENVTIYNATLRNFVKYIGNFPHTNYTPQHFDVSNRH